MPETTTVPTRTLMPARKGRAVMTPAQNEQYFRIRLDPFKLRHTKGMEHRAVCPLHGGSNPSQLWVDIAEGNWRCFSCGAKGGSAFAFEQAFLKVTKQLGQAPPADDIVLGIEAVLGTPFAQRVYPEPVSMSARGHERKGWDRTHARDSYRYTDELGNEVLTVWRFVDRNGHKITPADRPCPCGGNPDAECGLQCRAGRTWTTAGARRVLYRLPSVIGAQLVFVVEGEKNADDLSRALAEYVKRHGGFPLNKAQILDHVAVTTNPGGARGWKPDYGFGRYFAGKVVIKLGDNDEPGRAHDRDVCADIAPHALSTFTLALPVGEGEDVSDFLATHSIDDLLNLLDTRKEWRVRKPDAPVVADTVAPRPLLVRPSELVHGDAAKTGDWLVDGLIERGTRGLVVAPPKTGKSLLFLEMVLCLATRQSFLGKPPYHRALRCAVISREDGPGMVHRRLTQLAKPRGLTAQEIDRNLLVNTEEQSARFKIDRPQDLDEMAAWLKSEGVEFCVIDVLNRLHDQQENHSDDMTRVMQRFDEFAQRAGCQVCVIHHTNKVGGVKGSTAIEGWADYVVRLEQCRDDESVKTLFIKTKSSGTIPPRTIRYWQSGDQSESRIELVRQRLSNLA